MEGLLDVMRQGIGHERQRERGNEAEVETHVEKARERGTKGRDVMRQGIWTRTSEGERKRGLT